MARTQTCDVEVQRPRLKCGAESRTNELSVQIDGPIRYRFKLLSTDSIEVTRSSAGAALTPQTAAQSVKKESGPPQTDARLNTLERASC
eukprot:2817711-Pleurochrysis_carterae.AAC.1